MAHDTASAPATATGTAGQTRRISWLDRPRPSLKRIGTRYTRFVGMMKLVLPVTAGILMIMVVVWPQFRELPTGFRLGPAEIKIDESGGQNVVNARFTGTDSRNQPFTVTASALAQESTSSDTATLKNPKADVALQGGAWVVISAPRGSYRRKAQLLELDGGVTLFHDGGYEMRTGSATFRLAQGEAHGDDPVTGHGPLGLLNASGFRILDGGARILFTGKARLVIYPGRDGEQK